MKSRALPRLKPFIVLDTSVGSEVLLRAPLTHIITPHPPSSAHLRRQRCADDGRCFLRPRHRAHVQAAHHLGIFLVYHIRVCVLRDKE